MKKQENTTIKEAIKLAEKEIKEWQKFLAKCKKKIKE